MFITGSIVIIKQCAGFLQTFWLKFIRGSEVQFTAGVRKLHGFVIRKWVSLKRKQQGMEVFC